MDGESVATRIAAWGALITALFAGWQAFEGKRQADTAVEQVTVTREQLEQTNEALRLQKEYNQLTRTQLLEVQKQNRISEQHIAEQKRLQLSDSMVISAPEVIHHSDAVNIRLYNQSGVNQKYSVKIDADGTCIKYEMGGNQKCQTELIFGGIATTTFLRDGQYLDMRMRVLFLKEQPDHVVFRIRNTVSGARTQVGYFYISSGKVYLRKN